MTYANSKERGMISLDFLFAFSLIMGFSAILFALSLTLFTVEIAQYAAFAASRNYMAAHISEADQKNLANEKYKQLINHSVFRPLYKNGWFEVDSDPGINDHSHLYPAHERSSFIGARITFLAKMLDFQIPFYGSTTSTESEKEGFQTYITSYLGRESSVLECITEFTLQRWKKIRTLDARYSSNTSDKGYMVITDNGC